MSRSFNNILSLCPPKKDPQVLKERLEKQQSFVIWHPENTQDVYVFFFREGGHHCFNSPAELAVYLETPKPLFLLSPFEINTSSPILAKEIEEVYCCPSSSEFFPFRAKFYSSTQLESSMKEKEEYLSLFSLYHQALLKGEFKKLVLARQKKLQTREAVKASNIFSAALGEYPEADLCFIQLSRDESWVIASPEPLLEMREENLYSYAIAGTHHGLDAWTEKETAEQSWVGTHIAESIERMDIPYIQLARKEIKTAYDLRHLSTTFMLPELEISSALKLIFQLHPTPAIGGYPVAEAKRFIAKHEKERGYYTGFFGLFALPTALDLRVNIRCIRIQKDSCTLYAGGGLLRESVAEDEWRETETKLQTMGQLLGGEKQDETE